MGTTRRLQLVPLFADDDDENEVRAQDELYLRQMGRGSRATHRRTAVHVRTIRARLFGGIADGCTVELPTLSSEVFVHLDEQGRAHAADPTDAQLAGREGGGAGSTLYRLVNPAGPEEPTYVAPTP